MHRPDELDEYLRGDSTLSRQYRRENAPLPPHALDRRILDSSREARGAAPHLAPLAFAASVLLSVALVLAILFGPQTAQHAKDALRVVRAAAHGAPALRLYSSDPVHSAPAMRPYSSDLVRVRTPSAWLADIAALRRAGRNREADEELRRFRSAYPGYAAGTDAIAP